jgi:hypothetical protein
LPEFLNERVAGHPQTPQKAFGSSTACEQLLPALLGLFGDLPGQDNSTSLQVGFICRRQDQPSGIPTELNCRRNIERHEVDRSPIILDLVIARVTSAGEPLVFSPSVMTRM